jgi:hypothetical protein
MRMEFSLTPFMLAALCAAPGPAGAAEYDFASVHGTGTVASLAVPSSDFNAK